MTKESWLAANTLTPDKVALARRVVEDIRRGRNLGDSLRAHALPKGGVLGKSFLVAAYNEMIADGTLAADGGLLEQLTSPVRWQQSMEYLLAQGVRRFYEIGPGRVLAGLMRRIDRKAEVVCLNSKEAVEELAQT